MCRECRYSVNFMYRTVRDMFSPLYVWKVPVVTSKYKISVRNVLSYLDVLLAGGEGQAHQRDAVDRNNLEKR